MNTTLAAVAAALLGLHTSAIVALAVVLGRTRERVARLEGRFNGR